MTNYFTFMFVLAGALFGAACVFLGLSLASLLIGPVVLGGTFWTGGILLGYSITLFVVTKF